MIFIDTSIAIALRDLDRETHERVQELGVDPSISIMTRIELENGVNREPAHAEARRRLLDLLLKRLDVQMFTDSDVSSYSSIVHDHGYYRQRTLDRLIAAQAISRVAPLITRNGKDFRRIEKLQMIEW